MSSATAAADPEASSTAVSPTGSRKASTATSGAAPPVKKYQCQFCNRAFSRSEHRSRHERSRKSSLFAQNVQRGALHATKVGWRGIEEQRANPSLFPSIQTPKSVPSNV